MTGLLVFGVGYTAGHYLDAQDAWGALAGTVRTADKAAALSRPDRPVLVFDGDGAADPRLPGLLADSEALLVSAQPGASGDPVLRRFGSAIERAPRLERIVYLSTVGVYGDHGGAWIDERTVPEPGSARGRLRLGVEQAWLDLGVRTGKSVTVLRLAGIYGPGRNALADLAVGEARRVVKPGQVFNRIHVADIGRAIAGAFAHEGPGGTWNVADDEPAPAPDVIDYAAGLMGVPPPPAVPFAEAALSPMARSFYAANRRIANAALKRDLRVHLAFPDFRAGLEALWAAGEGQGARAG